MTIDMTYFAPWCCDMKPIGMHQSASPLPCCFSEVTYLEPPTAVLGKCFGASPAGGALMARACYHGRT
jgi:hypothetical protein